MADVEVSAGYPAIAAALVHQDFKQAIKLVREAVSGNPTAALSDPVIKDWLGRRYRNLFITEAAKDQVALRAARVISPSRADRLSSRDLLAKRFLKTVSREESQVEMPAAADPKLHGTTLVFVPSIMAGLLPVRAFQSVWPRIEDRFDLQVLTTDVHPVRSSDANVADIVKAFTKGTGYNADSDLIAPKRAHPPKDVILMGYSKGATDALTFLVDKPALAKRVKAFVGWAGAIGGSYVADGLSDDLAGMAQSPGIPLSGKIGKTLRQIVPVVQIDRIHSRLDEYDVKAAVDDLTTTSRERFLREHISEIATEAIPSFTFAGATSVRHVPYYQAMGVLQLNSRDKINDMFLTQGQTKLPVAHSTALATFRAHHWDMAYDPFPWFTSMGSLNVDHKFARYSALAALIIFLGELGLV